MFEKIWSVLLGMVFIFPVYGQDGLRRFLSTPGLEHAAVGISVRRVGDGKEVAAYASQMALTPASVTKLIPTYLALQIKGKQFRYTTTVCYSGKVRNGVLEGDLIVQAGGDPCWNSRYFLHHDLMETVFRKIEELKIQKIRGRILVEETPKEEAIPGSWLWEDISNYYGALCHSFNYRDNTYVLTFQSGEAGELTRLTGVRPALPGMEICNEVYASPRNTDNAWIYGGPYSSLICVKGTIPCRREAFQVKGAMHHPARVLEHELKEEKKKRDIPVYDEILPEGERVMLLSLQSPYLEEIVYHTNKSSINLFAEALGRLAGAGKWPEQVELSFREAGISTAGMVLKDACGLSVLNAVPARVFTDLLLKAYRDGEESFIRSLPVAGRDPGLNAYCRRLPQLQGKLRAKTGSMSGVRCLAGYLMTNTGETLVFAVLINHYTCSSLQVCEAVGRFLADFL